jgi:hypothetical protein
MQAMQKKVDELSQSIEAAMEEVAISNAKLALHQQLIDDIKAGRVTSKEEVKVRLNKINTMDFSRCCKCGTIKPWYKMDPFDPFDWCCECIEEAAAHV